MGIATAIEEVKKVVLSMDLTEVYLDSLIIFALSLLVLAIVSLPWYLAFIPFLIFLVYHVYNTVENFSFAQVEEKVPELKEALRTAADNIDQRNDVVEELFAEVLHKLKQVRTSYFLEFGQVSKQIILVAITCFLVVGIASFNVHFADISGVLSQGALFGSYTLEDLPELDRGNEEDIYGEESIADEGTEELPIELTPISNDVDVTREREIDSGRFENIYPDEVGAAVNDNYADQIPTKYQDIVKNYFKNIPR